MFCKQVAVTADYVVDYTFYDFHLFLLEICNIVHIIKFENPLEKFLPEIV